MTAQLVGALTLADRAQANVAGRDISITNNYSGPQDTSLEDARISWQPPIAKRAEGFIGRTLVLNAFQAFRAENTCGYFVIEGLAGLGKTAVASKIAADTNARTFFFDAALRQTSVTACLAHLCADLIAVHGLPYDRLPQRARQDSNVLVGLLEEAVAQEPSGKVTVVIDALDEADDPLGASTPVLLPRYLPPGAYFVVTRRFGQPLVSDTAVRTVVLSAHDDEQKKDVTTYIAQALAPPTRVARALAQAAPPVDLPSLTETLAERSEGNFLYLRLVLAGLVEHQRGTPLDLGKLPQRLAGYYEDLWDLFQRIADAEHPDAWTEFYEPLFARLAVAAEPVTAKWLGEQIGRSAREVERKALRRWSRVLRRGSAGNEVEWSAVHRSFHDFLTTKISVPATHLAIADSYVVPDGRDWSTWDDYGLRHVPAHLAGASSAPPRGTTRHVLVDRLVNLVTRPDYQAACSQRFADPSAMWRALVLGLRTATTDDDPAGLVPIANAARTLFRYRRLHLNPAEPFDLAMRGDVSGALSRLELLITEDLDSEWTQAVQLLCAWLAAPTAARVQALDMRDAVRANPPPTVSRTLELLAQYVDAALESGSAVQLVEPLPAPFPSANDLAKQALARMRGEGFDLSLMGMAHHHLGISPEMMGRDDSDVDFLAVVDAPLLVTIARDEPNVGEPALAEYIAIHREYGYPQYRNPSLWMVLDAILRYPNADWVLRHATLVGAAALDPSEVMVQEGLGLASLALRARITLGDAPARLATQFEELLAEANTMIAAKQGGQKGVGDTWSSRKRRLCVLAEAFARALGAPNDADRALQAAADIPFGFAGYQAPACLTLAESIRIVRPSDAAGIDAALEAARMAAHNIQASTFCARMTARVNAFRERFWPLRAAIPALVQQLGEDTSGELSAGVHIVGETYPGRTGRRMLELPPELRQARTPAQLALAYRRPLRSVLRLNADAGWAGDTALPDGTRVKMPDPGLAPLLAARLSGEILAEANMTNPQRTELLRTLVPATLSNPTALDTVLTRLLLTCLPGDAPTLDRLDAIVAIDPRGDPYEQVPRPLLPS